MQSVLDSIFGSMFGRFLLPTSTHWILKTMVFPKEKHTFLKMHLSKSTSIFDPILVPTWLRSGSQKPSKSFQKSIQRCIKFLIDFCIDFFFILAPSWDPSWGHVGHIFPQNGAGRIYAALLFVGSTLFFDFLLVLDPSWPNLGSILEGLGLHFGGFWGPFWKFLVTIWVPCGS